MCTEYMVNILYLVIFFFKQKTAYEMRISDWSSDVCSSDLPRLLSRIYRGRPFGRRRPCRGCGARGDAARLPVARVGRGGIGATAPKSVCAELVEAPFLFWQRQRKERHFGRLRANGAW